MLFTSLMATLLTYAGSDRVSFQNNIECPDIVKGCKYRIKGKRGEIKCLHAMPYAVQSLVTHRMFLKVVPEVNLDGYNKVSLMLHILLVQDC